MARKTAADAGFVKDLTPGWRAAAAGGGRLVLVALDVQVSSTMAVRLTIRDGDDPGEAAYRFATDYGLSPAAYDLLDYIVTAQVEELYPGYIPDEVVVRTPVWRRTGMGWWQVLEGGARKGQGGESVL